MKGIETYKTNAGFTVARVHYTADPKKDPIAEEGREWLKRALLGVKGGLSSSAWLKEMEIDFKARSGQRVFEGLELLKDKILIKPFSISDWWKVEGGYDWGKNNPFAYLEGSVNQDGQKYVIYGASYSGYEIPAQAQVIKKSPYFNRVHLRHADPSIWTEDQVARDGSYTSFQRVFSDLGITFIKGKTDDIACAERLEQEWFDVTVSNDGKIVKVPKENPTFKIFSNCEFLWDSLINLRWAEFSPSVEQERGKKEEIVHAGNDPWDALKYWYLSLPQASFQPKPRSKDRAIPLAGELLETAPKDSYKEWMS